MTVGCATCAALEAAGRDAGRRAAGLASLDLYGLIEHHIAVHDTAGEALEGCEACERWAVGGWGITPHLAARYARHHLVMHTLGIASDGPPGGLRFADTSAPVHP